MEIVKYPNQVLVTPAEKVKDPASVEIKQLVDEMFVLMHKNSGIGLAAPQIGKSIQLCIIEHHKQQYVLINPQITSFSKETTIEEEGCLSFPGQFFQVERPQKITVRYLNEKGEKCKIKAKGWLARVFQHEIDHLNGVLFINRQYEK